MDSINPLWLNNNDVAAVITHAEAAAAVRNALEHHARGQFAQPQKPYTYEVVEGKTPEITVQQARTLLASLDTSNPVGLRDRAIVAILIYTASRAGAIAKLRRGSFLSRRRSVDAALRREGRA